MSLRIALVLIVMGAGSAWAEDDVPTTSTTSTLAMAQDSAFEPNLQPANNQSDVRALAATSYNRATHATTVDLVGELALYHSLHLVLRVDNVATHGRPGVGASYQFLTEGKHGVSSTAYLLYKTEGFTEVAGEVEALVAVGKTIGPVRGVVNLAYGQDADAKERDGEIAVHVHTPIGARVLVGVTGTYRDALGSGGDRGVLRDAFGGLTGTVVVGPVALTAMAGIAGIQTMATGSMVSGPSATLAVGTGF